MWLVLSLFFLLGGKIRAGMSGAGAGGASLSGGAAAPAALWIDPELLEIKFKQFQACVCTLCFGVMVDPTTSGCPEGHSFCETCFTKELREKRRCPTCHQTIADGQTLVRNGPLADMTAQLQMMRCPHGEGGNEASEAGPSEAKRAKLAPAACMEVDALKTELRQRGLDPTGNKPELAVRLEEDRKKGAVCRWRGSVGELAGHLRECVCCTEKPLRGVLLEHYATIPCGHCATQLKSWLLAEHEENCPSWRLAQAWCYYGGV